MPRHRSVPKLEELCLSQFCEWCANTCTLLEQQELAAGFLDNPDDVRGVDESANEPRKKLHETKFVSFLRMLPRSVLESVIPLTLKIIAVAVRKNRSHKGLVKAVEFLPQRSLERLDFGALFTEVRLFGHVNQQCKVLLRSCLQRMSSLTVLNLSSKCTDDMLFELAKHCRHLEEMNVPVSDITDRGLMALAGISVNGTVSLENGDGCFNLVKLGVHNCINVSPMGVGCILRNLTKLQFLYYDKLVDAIETVAKIDGDYITGKKTFGIAHLDQFSEYYDFEAHTDIVNIMRTVCPKLESLRFFISDEGCKSLSQIRNIRHLQLEMSEDIGNGFRLLVREYTSLVSLHLTFRRMPFAQMIDVADYCPNVEVLRLIGFGVDESHNLKAHRSSFHKLKVVDVRMVRGDDYLFEDLEDDAMESNSNDTVTPQLLHFLLDYSHNLEDVTISAVANFVNEDFLQSVLQSNPMPYVQRLCISVSPSTALTADVARNVINALPSLHTMALSRWNVTAREIRGLRDEFRGQNYDIVFV